MTLDTRTSLMETEGKISLIMEVGYNIEAPFGVSAAPVLGAVLNN